MRIINLMFHDIFRESPSESGYLGVGPDLYKMPVERFTVLIKYCIEHKSKNSFVFTFDDGGISCYTIIAPVLEQFSLKGLFFIATGSIGKNGFMSEDQIAELDKRGHLIGSHSHTHRRLSTIPHNEVEGEWKESKSILERIVGHTVTIASIPNGYQSAFVLSEAEKCGYTDIYTSEPICTVKKSNSIQLHGRFVMMKNASISDIKKLNYNIFRVFLLLRSRFLLFLQKVLGSYYKSIRNKIIK